MCNNLYILYFLCPLMEQNTYCISFSDNINSWEEGKDQESIQSSTTPDLGYRMGR